MCHAHALKQYRTVRTGPCGAIPCPFHSDILFLFALLIFISAFIFRSSSKHFCRYEIQLGARAAYHIFNVRK